MFQRLNNRAHQSPLFATPAANYPARLFETLPTKPQESRVRLTFTTLLFACFIAQSAAADVTFRVRDRLAADEVEELTALFIDGQLIRSFRLGEDDRDVTIAVTVLEPGAHDYGLCGHLRLRAADGSIAERVVDVTGTIADVQDRDFEAVASDDFTRFFLVDATTSRPPTMITPHHAHACSPAVS